MHTEISCRNLKCYAKIKKKKSKKNKSKKRHQKQANTGHVRCGIYCVNLKKKKKKN